MLVIKGILDSWVYKHIHSLNGINYNGREQIVTNVQLTSN